MNFLVNIDLTAIDPMHLFLAVGAALLVLFYIVKTKFAAKNDDAENKAEVIEETMESTSIATGFDEEIVAVIAAAIAMAESESDGLKFRVVSFRRK